MAVQNSRKRSSDKGRHVYGTLVTLGDGTTSFIPASTLSDPTDRDAHANVMLTEGLYAVNVRADELPRIAGLLRELIAEQKNTNQYLAEMLGSTIGAE